MDPLFILVPLSAIIILVPLAYFFMRSNQTQLGSGFRLLQDSFESLQRNLAVHQKESERSQDAKASTLRTELALELGNNRRELQSGLAQTTVALELKVKSMDERLDHRLNELSQNVQTKLQANIKEGFLHFEKVQEHLKLAALELQNISTVGQSINDLNNLLRLPHLRGGFGEASLERLLSDQLPADSFELQYRIVPNSLERVDAVIKYPQQKVLPIDSKFPREQILHLFEEHDPGKLEAARKVLTDVMKTMARSVAEKYIHPEHGTTDMALLFVPSETLYFEILRNVRLCDDLNKFKVFVVSPNTLAVALHAISTAHAYYEMSQGVEKTLLEMRKSRQHFENFEKRFDEVGNALGKAENAFNTARTHLSRYQGAVLRLTGEESGKSDLTESSSSAQMPIPIGSPSEQTPSA